MSRSTAEGFPIRRPHLVYIAHDANDSRVLHRAHSLASLDIDLTFMAFCRDKLPRLTSGNWRTIDLGRTVDYAYLRRVMSVSRAALIVWRHRSELANVDALIARNLEQLLVARVVGLIADRRVPLAYECLDVHRLMVGNGLASRALRGLERWLLHSCELLVVSSLGFVDGYFRPMQCFAGRRLLLENKLPRRFLPVSRPPARPLPSIRPLTIGWFGMLRCMKSFSMLLELADARPDKLRIVVRGVPTEITIAAFEARIGSRANVLYGGPYRNPEDLAGIYTEVDMMWAIDYYDEGFGSEWLLPNRLYEAGFFCVPILTRAGTATAKRTEELGIGWTLEDPVVKSTLDLLDGLSPMAFAAVAHRVAATPRSVFVEDDDAAKLVDKLLARELAD